MIKLIKPYITFEEVTKDFQDIFESGWFTKGKNAAAFRTAVKSYTEAPYSFLTTSATTALSTCLKILEVGKGDEVIVADFSFPATVNVVEDVGATPIFADVDLDTYNMLPEELEKKITPKTKSVIFVDTFGNPSGLVKIVEICKKHDIPLIEDAACAIGSKLNGIKCGNIADFTCFSFHPRKLLTTGEGGAITTKLADYADKFEVKLNHGAIFKDNKMEFVDFGYNFRLSELQAVLGIKQLEKLDQVLVRRNIMRDDYIKELAPLGFKAQKILESAYSNIQSMVLTVPSGVNRDDLVQYLEEHKIEATLGTFCLSGTTYFQNKYNDVQPNARLLEETTITLPCHDDVDVAFVSNHIRNYFEKC